MAKEGSQALFYPNQFVVATCRQVAEFGSITAHNEKHYYRWTDPYPRTLDDLAHGGSVPNDQQRLIAGMLDKGNLLDLIHTFTIFGTNDTGETIKMVGRHQQFRAVKLAVKRMLKGKNKRERSGIIWHTQGSGKSLTMMFMVREMYRHPDLAKWKVVFVTDRTQLQQQLAETSKGVGYTVKVARSISRLKKLLMNPSSDLVMAMIHKFQEKDLAATFPELNASPNILVMTDEAHRSQYKLLRANLNRALPNATDIAYTGTPIEKTERVFGDYIDKYSMRQSIDDGVTLEIVYEGRTHNAEISDRPAAESEFADVFSDYQLDERLEILRYGSKKAYLEAKETIRAKASDIVSHYVEHVLPNGFKAQVVATSREAAVRYHSSIKEALIEKIAELERENLLEIQISLLQHLEVGVVISGSNNDLPHIKQHTNPSDHEKIILSFKLPFDAEREGVRGNVGIIIVNNMLLTGFDAPIEQVMYLDRVIKDHNLLQAIARVNRMSGVAKDKGFVVDYVGVGHHLKQALDTYDEKEQHEILEALSTGEDEFSDLKGAHRNAMQFLKGKGCGDLSDFDCFYDLFYDEDTRFEYISLFREFTRTLNNLFPHREALDFMDDYQSLAEINVMAERHLRDERLSMKGVPAKLRRITDNYLESKGIDQKVAPISIIDPGFQREVKSRKRSKTKAAEIEHAIRNHIEVHLDEDPELYASFAEEMERILQQLKDNWDEIYKQLEGLRKKLRDVEKEPTYGLHRKKQMPILRLLQREIYADGPPGTSDMPKLVQLTSAIFDSIERELRLTGFWESIPARNRLKAEIQEVLLSPDYVDLPNIKARYSQIISQLMELAQANNDTILYAL